MTMGGPHYKYSVLVKYIHHVTITTKAKGNALLLGIGTRCLDSGCSETGDLLWACAPLAQMEI